jgi:alpha-1,3-rhamnosyl/mannosyltransferase
MAEALPPPPELTLDHLGITQGERRVRRLRRQADFLFWLESRARLGADLAPWLPHYDIYHSTEPYSVAPHRPGDSPQCKRVATCHDLIPLLFPDLYPQPTAKVYYRWLRGALQRVDAVIAISEAVKASLVERLDLPPAKVAVVPHGVEPRFFAPPDPDDGARLAALGVRAPFFFYGGGADPRKRLDLLLDAFADARRDVPEQLVLCGHMGRRAQGLRAHIARLGVGDRVALLPYIDEAALLALYRGATAFVFPSLYEGFGLPILEAQAAGCPVITARRSAMPEVAGDAALYIDANTDADAASDAAPPHPDDPTARRALTAHLITLSADADARARLRALGLANAHTFTWARTATLTLRAYARALTGAPQA